MDCVNHPDRVATAVCQRCDKTLCEGCVETRGARRFCAECAAFFDRRYGDRDDAPAGVAPGQPADVYQGPPADVYQGPPAAEPPRHAPPADVYQGPPPGSVDQGSPPGDLYQGPAPGDVYQGPAAGAPSPVAGAGAAGAAGAAPSFSIRALLAGIFGVAIAAGLYYWIYTSFDLRMKFFVLIMALIVGLTARIGGGRAGGDIGVMAALLFVVSVIAGDYAVTKSFYDEIAESAALQRQALNEIRIDGRYTADEARRLRGYTAEEWSALSEEERGWERESLQDEYQEARAEGWDPRELYDPSGLEALGQQLSFGSYLGSVWLHLGLWGIAFLVLGSWEAYKIGATETS